MGKKIKKKKKLGDYLLTLVLIVALGVFLYAAYNLYHIYSEYKKGEDEYKALEEMAVKDNPEAEEQDDSDGDKNADKAPEEVKPPIAVDFNALKAVNKDVVAWIYVEALDISYPVVRGKDNDYYLHRTYEGTYNFAGSIFEDYANSPDFNDCNTLVYGHNMKNGSMFGILSRFTSENAYEKSRYFWILTPDHDYRYEIFSAYTTPVNSDTYTLFSKAGKEFTQYLKQMQANSEIPTQDVKVTGKDKVVTLSTCTGNDSTRYVVQGKRLKEAVG